MLAITCGITVRIEIIPNSLLWSAGNGLAKLCSDGHDAVSVVGTHLGVVRDLCKVRLELGKVVEELLACVLDEEQKLRAEL